MLHNLLLTHQYFYFSHLCHTVRHILFKIHIFVIIVHNFYTKIRVNKRNGIGIVGPRKF